MRIKKSTCIKEFSNNLQNEDLVRFPAFKFGFYCYGSLKMVE